MPLAETLLEIYRRPAAPEPDFYLELLTEADALLRGEPNDYRPTASDGLAGGLVYLDPRRITVVVPDIHARMDFVLRVLSQRLASVDRDERLISLLQSGEAQLVCLGDYVHAEMRARNRWLAAHEEFTGGYAEHSAMDEEMRESLGTVEMLLTLKRELPDRVHLLKGNHENVTNQEGEGNLPFGKFAYEGAMVAAYMEQFYGDEVLETFARVEHAYPLLTVGPHFLVTHAEPQTFYGTTDVVEYRSNPEVVFGLTWTPNDGAEPDSVERMLLHYLGTEEAFHFGGHRPISGKYALRANGRYVQLHNPMAQIAAVIAPDRSIDLSRDVIVLSGNEDR